MNDRCLNEDIGKLLHAYELNLLHGDEKDRFEAHVLECGFCYNELKSFAPRGLLLAKSEEIKGIFAKGADSKRRSESIRSALWPDKPLIFRPALLYFIMALLIWPSIIGFRMLMDNSMKGEIVPVQKISLVNLRSGPGAVFERAKNRDGIIVVNCPEIDPGTEYILEIIGENNSILFSDRHFTDFDIYGNAELAFPRSLMRAGNYKVVVSKRAGDSVEVLYRYEFGIE